MFFGVSDYRCARLYTPGELPVQKRQFGDTNFLPSSPPAPLSHSALQIFDTALVDMRGYKRSTFPLRYDENWKFAVDTQLTSGNGADLRVRASSLPGEASSHPLHSARRRVLSELSVSLECVDQGWSGHFIVRFHPFFSIEWEEFPTFSGAEESDKVWWKKLVDSQVAYGPAVWATPEVTSFEIVGNERAIVNYALLLKLSRPR
ncbi:hypothetical protein VQ042_24000 [Aurantimonas sp. A2-1-M11]|uniref:hypothetical protein n=1 Tax=Aurantimonas sp. A2-1-M11 TaxID=3113712 RepID=UPI002F934EC9